MLELPKINDFHVHLRQGDLLKEVVPFSDRVCNYALVMPNTDPPILTVDDVNGYRREIERVAKRMLPLMTLKLTRQTDRTTILKAKERVIAAKLYPEGVTTNSGDGIPLEDLNNENSGIWEVFRVMQDEDIVLSIHGELPGAFCLKREALFLPIIEKILYNFPHLRVVLEHISTKEAANFVERQYYRKSCLAATITLHHLILTLDDVVGNTIKPHNFCKPIAKTEDDRKALLRKAISGMPCFFFGSDSAPHIKEKKESSCGCAGCFTAPVMLELLVKIFENQGALDKLPDFTNKFGREFYQIGNNTEPIKLEKEDWLCTQTTSVVPFWNKRLLEWAVTS